MSVELGLMPVLHALMGSVRVLAMLLSAPIFNHPALSMRIRLMAALLIAWAVAPAGVGALAEPHWDVLTLAAAVGVEVMIGLSVGIGTGLVFAAVLQLGQFIGIQGGLGAVRSIDPSSGAPSVAIGSALHTFAMLVFLAIGGHHELLRGISTSFETLPVGGGLADTGIFYEVAKLGSVIFEVALRFAAPMTVAILIQNVAMGVLGRAMPQLNLLIVNLPLQVGTLLLVIGLGANDLMHAFKDVLEVWPGRIFAILLGAS